MALDPHFKAICFDMDGTFMNTKVDYVKLANVIFDELIDMGVPESAIDRSGGSRFEIEKGIGWLFDHGRGDEVYQIQDRVSKRSTDVEMEYADEAKVFDGSVEVVKLMRKKGLKAGILTRGGHRYAEYIMRNNDVYDYFDAVIARDDFPEKEAKPSPVAMENMGRAIGVEPKDILFLGDHRFDWMTARDSGAGFYGVMTGHYHSKEDWFKACGEDVPTINSIKDLLDII